MAVKPTKIPESFALIEWMGENLFNVLPLCYAKDPIKCRAGVCADFKWVDPNTKSKKKSKYFKALVLKISRDRRELKELEDKIIDGEMLPDDIAGMEFTKEEEIIDSTTPERPQKRTAIWEAFENDSDEEYQSTPKRPLSSGSGSVVNRVRMKGQNSINVKVACGDTNPQDDSGFFDGDLEEMRRKDEKIRSLNHRIQALEVLLHKQKAHEEDINTKSCRMSEKKDADIKSFDCDDFPLVAAKETGKFPLVPGYTVYVTRPQVDEVVDSSGGSATKMIRNLLMVFFTPNVLAKSSCFGSRKFPALQKEIIAACLKFVMTKHPNVPRSTLVDAVNDKCANFRRNRVSAKPSRS